MPKWIRPHGTALRSRLRGRPRSSEPSKGLSSGERCATQTHQDPSQAIGMCRGTMVLLVCLSLQAPVMGQTVGAVVDCGGKRLAGAERETCASPDPMRLTKDVDQTTGPLETAFKGRHKEAPLGTGPPLQVGRQHVHNTA